MVGCGKNVHVGVEVVEVLALLLQLALDGLESGT